jgi:hypothetical protein
MARPCSVCTHPKRDEIDSALLIGESLRNIAKQFSVGSTAVFRHKDHVSKTLVKAAEADAEIREITRGEDLLQQVRDLNQRTLRILRDAETTGDSRTALAAVREARGNAELLCKMLVAMDMAKPEEDSPEDIQRTMDNLKLLVFGRHSPSAEPAKALNPQGDETRKEWVDRMAGLSAEAPMTR